MLGKILLLGLGVWLILTLLKQYRRSIDEPAPSKPESQDMVQCPVCGVHQPKSESVEVNGTHYCCKEHSQKNE